jgi:sugar phosphate isomerase/epimerase
MTQPLTLEQFTKIFHSAFSLLGEEAQLGIRHVHVKEIYEACRMVYPKLKIGEYKIFMRQLHESDYSKYECIRATSKYADNLKYGFMRSNGLYCYMRYKIK